MEAVYSFESQGIPVGRKDDIIQNNFTGVFFSVIRPVVSIVMKHVTVSLSSPVAQE